MPLWKHIARKPQLTASLLVKPTPRNVDRGNGRFAMFNKERDISEHDRGDLYPQAHQRFRLVTGGEILTAAEAATGERRATTRQGSGPTAVRTLRVINR